MAAPAFPSSPGRGQMCCYKRRTGRRANHDRAGCHLDRYINSTSKATHVSPLDATLVCFFYLASCVYGLPLGVTVAGRGVCNGVDITAEASQVDVTPLIYSASRRQPVES